LLSVDLIAERGYLFTVRDKLEIENVLFGRDHVESLQLNCRQDTEQKNGRIQQYEAYDRIHTLIISLYMRRTSSEEEYTLKSIAYDIRSEHSL
jgi:hypothetical protein